MSNYYNNNSGYTPNYHYPEHNGYGIPPQHNYNPPIKEMPLSDRLSLVSLICGIVGMLICSFVLSIMAIVFSCKYYTNNGNAHCSQSKAGMVCGIIGFLMSVIFLLLVIAFLSR